MLQPCIQIFTATHQSVTWKWATVKSFDCDAAHDLQSHTPHFVVSLMTNWSISEEKATHRGLNRGEFCGSDHVAMTAGSTTQDYETGTVRGRVTASTSALVLIDSTRWKATRTGYSKSPPPLLVDNQFRTSKPFVKSTQHELDIQDLNPVLHFLNCLYIWSSRTCLVAESSRQVPVFGAVLRC